MEHSLIAVISYVIGSIPFGFWLAKYVAKTDITKHGSKNIGATNVNRILGKKLGFLTLLLDMLKAYICVYLATYFFDETAGYYALLFVVLGHCFSVYLKFRGGKGVASFLGGIFALNEVLGVICAVSWLVMYAIRRKSSIAALFMLIVAVVTSIFTLQYFLGSSIITFLCVLITIKHKNNIKDFYQKG